MRQMFSSLTGLNEEIARDCSVIARDRKSLPMTGWRTRHLIVWTAAAGVPNTRRFSRGGRLVIFDKEPLASTLSLLPLNLLALQLVRRWP